MPDMHGGRHEHPGEWAGWVAPADRAWILLIGTDGSTVFDPKRDADGGVIEAAR